MLHNVNLTLENNLNQKKKIYCPKSIIIHNNMEQSSMHSTRHTKDKA